MEDDLHRKRKNLEMSLPLKKLLPLEPQNHESNQSEDESVGVGSLTKPSGEHDKKLSESGNVEKTFGIQASFSTNRRKK